MSVLPSMTSALFFDHILPPPSPPRRHLAELLRRRRHRARLLALPILDLAQVVPDRRLGRVAAPRVQLYDLHVLEK